MKKLRIIFAILVLFSATAFSNKVFALTSSDLISVGSGEYAITVTTNSTVEDIINVLGEPKICTKSAFGGHAYTFYTDSDYNNYLYIETTEDNKIISFGSVDPTYKTNTYSYGDAYNYKENGALHGCLFNNNSVVEGGIYYNKSALINKSVSTTINRFKENYESNPSYYLKGISQQSVAMYNALSTRLGNKTELVFDEEFFYINEQLKESSSSIRTYLADMDKSNYMKAIGIRENIEISNSIYYLLNPMMFASMVKDNKNAVFGDKNIAILDYDINKKLLSAITVGKDVFERHDPIELTTEEIGKMSAGRAEYEEAIKNLNLDSELYDVIPQSTNVTTLTAGVLKASKKEGITNYINAIRAAAGLPKLQINDDAFLVAQHISTLISYRYTELNLPITHVPEQPEGLSDEYYKTAVGYGRGYAENLGFSATSSTASIMMYHINLFLDDSSENPQNFSHRAKIIDPEYTGWGYGISPYTFSNEFSGYKASDVFLEAWPSEGVTFLESLVSKRFYWSAQFIDKYKITDSTTVTVKCLNTGDTWNYTTEEESSTRKFQRYTNAIQSLNNKVIFYDYSIVPEQGYVYEITLNNILDEDTDLMTEYKYRAAFEYADVSSYPTTSNSISIEVPDNIKKVENENVYYVPVGEEVKLTAVLDDSAVDKKVTWVSSSENVKVTQNGTIIAQDLLDEDVTISVSYDGSNVTAQVVVRPYNKIEQVKLEPDFVTLEKGDNGQIHVTYIPEDANEQTEITWKVVSCANTAIEYDINDPYILKYIKVETIEGNSLTINVTAIDAEEKNNQYKIIAYVQGISGDYTGTCTVTINVPLSRMDITGSGLSFTSAGVGEPRDCTIIYNDYYSKNNTNIIGLDLNYDPKNTTVERNVDWEITGDQSVITAYVEPGTFRIDKEGETTITAIHGKGTENEVRAILNLTIVSNLESLSIAGTTNNIKLVNIGSGYTAQDTLTTTKYPEIDTDEIIYTSSNTNIATVDSTGNVSFVGGIGTVTITASNKSKSLSSSYTYNVIIPIDTMQLPNVAATTQTLKKGESIQHQVTYTPSNTSCSNYISYSSSNTSVATVDKNGIVKGISSGTATITATISGAYTKSGNPITTNYKVNVVVPVESISTVDTLTLNLEEGSKTVTVDISPSGYTDSVAVKWESSNTNVLTINSTSGKITPVKSGRAIVTVTVTASNSGGTQTFTRNISVLVKSINDPEYLKGDLDRNGVVNANDAAVALDLYKYNTATYEDILIGDMDGNDLINANDAAMILDIYKYGNNN